MKKYVRVIAVLVVIFTALAVPPLLFFKRAPVLVVTDALFATLYGTPNLKRQQIIASLKLFRQVKPVLVADGAGSDIVILAIVEASPKPLCVLFARSNVQAVRPFHQQYPEIPIVLFSGVLSTSGLPTPDDFLYVYGTDREVDLYRAGLFAGILGIPRQENSENGEEQEKTTRRYALWQDRQVQAAGREAFSRGLTEQDPGAAAVFANSSASMPDPRDLACAVLTGAGAEYFEKNPKIPLVLFSWLDPDLTAKEVMVQFDDSAWALAVPAVRMAMEKQTEGKIPSSPLIFSGKIADNNIFRELRKSAKKMP